MRTKTLFKGQAEWLMPTKTGVLLHVTITDEQDAGREVQVAIPNWQWSRLLDQAAAAKERQQAPVRRGRQRQVA